MITARFKSSRELVCTCLCISKVWIIMLHDVIQEAEELVNLAPDKMLLKWMNFHIKKAGYKKTVTNFSTDVKDGEAYAYLLSALAPEHSSTTLIETTDPKERAKKVLETAEKLDCTRYVTSKDIVEGSANLNLAFVAEIFQHRNGLSSNNVAPVVEDTPGDVRTGLVISISSLALKYIFGILHTFISRSVLLVVLDKTKSYVSLILSTTYGIFCYLMNQSHLFFLYLRRNFPRGSNRIPREKPE
uniref:Calponin-homology (CH) domain-containing protein n=1 Tax=Aegilops tauschii subsp. strangulata TaxID=200361 RepID=A0A453NZ61_AEGTS